MMRKIEPSAVIAESNHGTLLRAWRRANAEWDLARYADDVAIGDDLPDDVDSAHCTATHNALMAFLLHPAQSLGDLVDKLRVARDEDAQDLTDAGAIMTVLAKDARSLWLADERNKQRPKAA
jgi:hypothetical protein